MTTDLNSILARLKPQKDVTLEMQSAEDNVWRDWSGWSREDFSAALLDLVQRQDEDAIALRAERDALKESLEASTGLRRSVTWPLAANPPEGPFWY